MNRYYYHNGNEQVGPVSIEELIKAGINRDTSVWREGLNNWCKAGELDELRHLFATATPPPFTPPPSPPPPPFTSQANASMPGNSSGTAASSSTEIIGIFTRLKNGESLEVENPTVSLINFEKGAFFKSYDTCIGKVYLTNQRILILKLIILEAKNMKIASEEQFGSALGQWFDIPLEYVANVSTPRQGFFRSLFKGLIGEKKEGLEIRYDSPMETEKKSMLFGTKKVRESFIIVFTIDNKELWNMKIQTCVMKARSNFSGQ